MAYTFQNKSTLQYLIKSYEVILVVGARRELYSFWRECFPLVPPNHELNDSPIKNADDFLILARVFFTRSIGIITRTIMSLAG